MNNQPTNRERFLAGEPFKYWRSNARYRYTKDNSGRGMIERLISDNISRFVCNIDDCDIEETRVTIIVFAVVEMTIERAYYNQMQFYYEYEPTN